MPLRKDIWAGGEVTVARMAIGTWRGLHNRRCSRIGAGRGSPGAWDARGGLRSNHERNALAVDRPIGGLLPDRAQRGLLDETLVVFDTEFGRTPRPAGVERPRSPQLRLQRLAGRGRDQGDVIHVATDEISFHAVADRHFVTDIHATILKQL
jgi:hypothetical protein